MRGNNPRCRRIILFGPSPIRAIACLWLFAVLTVLLGACTLPAGSLIACFISKQLPGLTVAFDATSCSIPSGPVVSLALPDSAYEWDFGDGTVGVGAKVQHHYNSPGTYTVTLRIFTEIVQQGTDSIAVDYTDRVWPMFLHDPQHTGESPFVGTHSPFVGTHGTRLAYAQTNSSSGIGEKWAFQTGGAIRGSAGIDKFNVIYISSTDGNVYAINPDGTEKWRFPTNSDGGDSPAIGPDGTIYVGSTDSNVYALNPDGTLKWKFLTGGPVFPRPTVGSDGTIYIGSDDHKLYALNPDGSLKWAFATGGSIESSPAISHDGSTIYVGSFDGKMYAINASDGTPKPAPWPFDSGAPIQSSSPTVAPDGTIYFGNGAAGTPIHRVYALNPNGTEKWHFDSGMFSTGAPSFEVGSSPAIGQDGTVYIGSHDFNLYALRPDGTLKWRFQTQGVVFSSPAIDADGVIFIASSEPTDHHVYAINPDGSEQWRFLLGGPEQQSSPVIGSDGAIYVGADDGKLHVIIAVP